MNFMMSIVVVGLCSLLAITAAVPQSSKGGRQTCYDGRLCQCLGVLDETDYKSARYIVQCLDQLGVQHDFSSGSGVQITSATCQKYDVSAITNSKLRVCVYKKIGFIKTINGVDQWDLDYIRRVGIALFSSRFPKPEEAGIKNIFVTTLLTCKAHPRNFEVFPFEDCLDRAFALVLDILQRENQGNTNLSQEGVASAKGATKLSSEMLKASNADLELAKDLDVVALI